jgi:hypothetical protein
VAVPIGRPSRNNRRWNPHCTVGWNYSPRTVLIKVFISNYARRNITSGIVPAFTAIAHPAPIVETIEPGCFINLMCQRSTAAESGALIGANANCGAVAGSITFTFSDRHQGDLTAGTDVEAILA